MDGIWNGRVYSRDQILSKGYNIEIKRMDLLTLRGLEWLNDEVHIHTQTDTDRHRQISSLIFKIRLLIFTLISLLSQLIVTNRREFICLIRSFIRK